MLKIFRFFLSPYRLPGAHWVKLLATAVDDSNELSREKMYKLRDNSVDNGYVYIHLYFALKPQQKLLDVQKKQFLIINHGLMISF